MTDGSASILTSGTLQFDINDYNGWAEELLIEPGSVNETNEIPSSGKSALSPARAKKRKADKMSRDKIEEKLDFVHRLLPSCSKAKERRSTKATKLDEIKEYLLSLRVEIDMLKQKTKTREVSSIDDACNLGILKKFEADIDSQVKFSDFNLEDERIMVGKYSFPPSLCPIVGKINNVYGDVSATSKFNHHSIEGIYIMLCASIKEMDDLRLEQITEDRILKWKDVIKDALRMNFNVKFAMTHLKKIVHAYIGLMERQKLDDMNLRMSNLEAQLNTEKDEYSKIYAMSKLRVDAAEEFINKPVSSGIFG